MVKVVQICCLLSRKHHKCLKDDYVKASQTSALKVSLHRAVLVIQCSYLLLVPHQHSMNDTAQKIV